MSFFFGEVFNIVSLVASLFVVAQIVVPLLHRYLHWRFLVSVEVYILQGPYAWRGLSLHRD